jgi:hypothetical protein
VDTSYVVPDEKLGARAPETDAVLRADVTYQILAMKEKKNHDSRHRCLFPFLSCTVPVREYVLEEKRRQSFAQTTSARA